jgi:spectinomycin phosphotransferase/16S rRNA (guanine(1405)-N(7))-methyltransferase
MEYLAVGWGSHHWDVRDDAGGRWFVTVDELENKRVSDAQSVDDGFERLRASLLSAVALREAGCAFVVAPVPGDGGEPAVGFGGRFAVAVYPFVRRRAVRLGRLDTQGAVRDVQHGRGGAHGARVGAAVRACR